MRSPLDTIQEGHKSVHNPQPNLPALHFNIILKTFSSLGIFRTQLCVWNDLIYALRSLD